MLYDEAIAPVRERTEQLVTADESGIRLDRWFRRHFPGLPQSVVQKLCRTGQIRVDGHRTDAATRLDAGQAVRVPPLPADRRQETRPAPATDPRVEKELQRLVLYRDEHLIVINKPHGLPVQGGPGISRHLDAMLDALRSGSLHRPRLVHRLDRDTSGVLLLARTPGTAARLAALFRSSAIDKTYWAVTARRPSPPDGRISLPLARVSDGRGQRMAVAAPGSADGARAVTEYRTLDHAGQKLAWLELHPRTGRTHQLRVHCVAIGAPILGDRKYARPDQNGAFAASVQGLADDLHLHARSLSLPHPAGGMLLVEADLPPHMVTTFRTLGFHARPARSPLREP